VVEKEKLMITRKRKQEGVIQNPRKKQPVVTTIAGRVRRRKRWKSRSGIDEKKTTTITIVDNIEEEDNNS
jgi:hypothetical protein